MITPLQLMRLLIIVVALLAGCASLGSSSPLAPVERFLVFQPAPYPAGDWYPANLHFEDAWFESHDGTQLHGWFVGHSNPRGVALFCHGNAGNVTALAESLRILNKRHRLAVLAVDYRGYGRSQGRPTESGILDDARAARRWLAEKTEV